MYRWLAILLLISSCQSAPKASLYPIPHRQRLTCSGDTSQVHVRYVGKEKDYDLVELKTDKATYLFG
ncbi:MAG: hypothetical protein KDD43_02915, partial [Bdellovibrionales bacterium]|nr:hypothetical protein [Bdellovibrionales bacterium]